MCALLDSNFNAIRDCGKKTLWDKRVEFIDTLLSENQVVIDASVFPSDGINISDKQIRDVWKIFHIAGDCFPEGVNQLLLREIKEHRNAIAHGREKAKDIGSRYTVETLQQKEAIVEKLCLHIINGFKSAYTANDFLSSQIAV